MTKKIAVINDLSGFGRCSLTAAISVLSAMGVSACPLPTAILSAQTGYPSYFCDDYTDKMENFRREWEKMNVSFDGIYTGYVASEQQIENIFHFLDTFMKEDTFLLVDPVMGDNGHVYSMYTNRLLDQMRKLVSKARVTTPNLTELCLLEQEDYALLESMTDQKAFFAKIEAMAKNLVTKGPSTVLVTGIPFVEKESNIRQMGNLAVTKTKTTLAAFPYTGGSYSGTGDLFASVIAAALARNIEPERSMELAGRFIERSILDTAAEEIPGNDGINYEQHLGSLILELNTMISKEDQL